MIFRFAFFSILLFSCTAGDSEYTITGTVNYEEMMGITYLALGDSYTIGESVPEPERWPVQLKDSLNRLGYPVSPLKIIARTGWTTDELAMAIQLAGITETFDLVSLLIGVNNQYRGRPVEEFRIEFIRLLDKAIQLAANDTSRVFVLSIPDWGVTPFASNRDKDRIAQEIDLYNTVKEEETQKKNVLFIDITDISRQAESNPSLIAPDGLHPSGEMYTLWVERIIPLLTETLNRSTNGH
jgi:lysophospholipase L1-like esterase